MSNPGLFINNRFIFLKKNKMRIHIYEILNKNVLQKTFYYIDNLTLTKFLIILTNFIDFIYIY